MNRRRNLFPRPEVQFAFGDRDDDFAAHDLTLEVGVSIVFASAIVAISGGRLVRREFFQPDLVIACSSNSAVNTRCAVNLTAKAVNTTGP